MRKINLCSRYFFSRFCLRVARFGWPPSLHLVVMTIHDGVRFTSRLHCLVFKDRRPFLRPELYYIIWWPSVSKVFCGLRLVLFKCRLPFLPLVGYFHRCTCGDICYVIIIGALWQPVIYDLYPTIEASSYSGGRLNIHSIRRTATDPTAKWAL